MISPLLEKKYDKVTKNRSQWLFKEERKVTNLT